MTQRRRHSVLESIVNVAVGLVINFAANAFIFPRLGWQVTTRQNLILVTFYTAISVARSYILRRLFNRITTRTTP